MDSKENRQRVDSLLSSELKKGREIMKETLKELAIEVSKFKQKQKQVA